MQEIERMQQELEQRKLLLRSQSEQLKQAPPQKSATPVWDEIDTIMKSLSDEEYQRMTANEEFDESSKRVAAIVQEMQIRMIRPHVESSKEGREALDCHLTLVKRLRSALSKEVDNELADFKNYRENYAHLSYEEYLKQQREKKGGRK